MSMTRSSARSWSRCAGWLSCGLLRAALSCIASPATRPRTRSAHGGDAVRFQAAICPTCPTGRCVRVAGEPRPAQADVDARRGRSRQDARALARGVRSLRFLEGRCRNDIAELLNLPEGTVASRVRLARKEVRTLLAREFALVRMAQLRLAAPREACDRGYLKNSSHTPRLRRGATSAEVDLGAMLHCCDADPFHRFCTVAAPSADRLPLGRLMEPSSGPSSKVTDRS